MLKNGARTVYTYDEVGRLESLVNYGPDDWVISSYGYLRNDVGCPTRITATRAFRERRRVAWTKLRFVA